MMLDEVGFTPATLTKGAKAVASDLVEPDKDHPSTIWWVRSERDATKVYRVQSDIDAEGDLSWVTCTCPHGLHSGGGRALCYHAASALLFMEAKRAEYAASHDLDDDEAERDEAYYAMRREGTEPGGPDTVWEARGEK